MAARVAVVTAVVLLDHPVDVSQLAVDVVCWVAVVALLQTVVAKLPDVAVPHLAATVAVQQVATAAVPVELVDVLQSHLAVANRVAAKAVAC